MDSLKSVLREYYGWELFKTGQREILEAILAGTDVLGVLPTGGGKSLCYQLPALALNGLVVVVSPLVALMENQVIQLQKRSIRAICLHGGLDPGRRKDALISLQDEELRLLYLAPERLHHVGIRKFLARKVLQEKIVAIAIDEAHCISSWGHDFRPEYRRLGEIRQLFPSVPIVALTATASPKVRADIIRLLNLRKPLIKVCSARRNNLHYSMLRRPKDSLPAVLKALEGSRGASLIYVRTRRLVEQWTQHLRNNGIPAIPYHAGIEPVLRQKALADFLELENPVLIATVAFGMGVDRSDVGLVLHLNLPSTPERYLQESGRAGRDGLDANCLVLFSPGDRMKLGWAIKASATKRPLGVDLEDEKLRLEISQEQLRKMEAIAEGDICIEQALLLAVGELVPPCGRCDRCIESLPAQDWSKQALVLLKQLDGGYCGDIHSLVECIHEKLDKSERSWGWLARRLVQEELIRESNDGSQRIFIRDNGRRFIKNPWPLHYAA